MAPAGLYSRLKNLYKGPGEPRPPPLTTSAALVLLVVYTLLYVLPFYISSSTRPSPQLSRDAPSVIRARIRSVAFSCFACSIVTFITLASVENGSPFTALHQMGYFPLGLEEAAKCVLLTAILFLGPLFKAGIVNEGWKSWIRLQGLDEVFNGWIGWRNIVIGPITEEVLFRSASVPILVLTETSSRTIIFLTPVIFGLAHIHHFHEFRITHPHTPMIQGVLRSFFQFSYTTLFGGYATFIYLRTGSLLNIILVHAFCNWMGFPQLWGRLTSDETLIGPDVSESKKSEDQDRKSWSGQLSVIWTVFYYALLVVGAVGWYKYFWTLTESEMALKIVP